MTIVGRDKLEGFCNQHADARRPVESWLAEAESANWATPQGIKDRYASASFLGGNTVIFNIKGNDYRLEVTVAYRTGIVVVGWLGTHAEYDSRNRRR
jgi:mRNA interferase HigB